MIEIRQLAKRYGTFEALKGVSFEIDSQDLFGFIGPNGAGKTTTIRILSTLLEPTTGAAFIDGIDVVKHPQEVKRIIGYMPDSFGVYDGMRLREYLDFFGAAYRIPAKKRRAIIDDVLTLTDLHGRADDFVSTFSRGMKQRACLAKTLIHDPKVLLLDEPASGLDPRARIEIKELLKTLRGMGKTILISSHILSELGDMCNKIGIIERGELLAFGSFREILARLRQTREIRMHVVGGAETALAMLQESPSITKLEHSGGEFNFETTMNTEAIAGVLSALVQRGVQIVHFAEDEGTLEDVFLHVTKGGV